MPQGKIIAVRPSLLEGVSDANDLLECDGDVEVLDGRYEGQILPFKERGKCCKCEHGDEVTIEITEMPTGRLKAKITDCPKCK
ncbi:hypothetical protein GCM10023188_31860 [Pontibacter saemangeumensis]|uniref:Uncharacterized protein n=1 Tax=Pontibacter saemangeumensis TaxID=1084525 RepID=A0ABP8LWN1_9BACT